jgi:hypothetical protein
MHVLSALWINLIGHKFDAVLPKTVYGSRLRRYRGTAEGKVGEYHVDALGSFQPYWDPYKRWREGGLKAIRGELNADRPVIALSLDLTGYYHNIDPTFLSDPEYLSIAGIEINDWEKGFTDDFVNTCLRRRDPSQTLSLV